MTFKYQARIWVAISSP